MPAAPRVRSALSRSLDRALALVALLALMLAIVETALLPLAGPAGPLLVMLPLIFAVYIVAGLIAWKRRPSNGMGFLIVVAGFALYLGSLPNTGVPLLVGIGAVCATLVVPAMVHLLLAFPAGRLSNRMSRVLVAAMYLVALVLQAPGYLFDPGGPFPPFAVADAPRVVEFFSLFQTIAATAVSAAVAVVLWGRLRRADAAHRRVLIPVFSYGIFAVLFLPLIAVLLDRVLFVHPFIRGYLQFAVLAGVPIAFALGTLRGGFARTGELEELGTWLGTASAAKEPLTTALARALGDPSLRLYFWASDRDEFLDADGREASGRPTDGRRGWERIVLDDRTIGAIEYDAALLAEAGLVRTAGRVVAIEVERARLTAELRASQRALMQSRERIVEAADRERRRIARDLHDGLQVRLVLLALEAQQLATAPSATVSDRATRLRVDIDAAAADLRALVRDLMPAALIERGLAAAAEDLADRMPIPTQFESDIEDGAIADLVEATTFFVLTEALANVVKHANATLARVRLAVADGHVHLEVEDDGVGGASAAGSGLRGLADRVEAIGGTISISSPRGKGTRVRAEVPCA